MTLSTALTGTARIARAFARAREEKRLAIVVYLTVGYPDRAATGALLRAALDGGADLLELGVPFSDPLADGATVQRASEVALRQGVSLRDCIAEASAVVRAMPTSRSSSPGCVATPCFPLPSDSASARPSTSRPCGAWPTPSWSGAPRWTRSPGRRRRGDPKPFVRLSRCSRRLGKADASAWHPRRDDRRQQRGARDLRRDARDAQHHRQAEWRAARRRRLHLVHRDRRLERRLPGGRRTRRARLDRRAARLRARNTGARGTRALRPCAHRLEHSENAEGDPSRLPSRCARASSFLGGRSARRRAPWGALVLVVMKRDATKEEIDAV